MLLHTHMMSALIPFLSSCRRCFSSSFSTCQHRRHQKQGPQTPLKGLSRKVGQQYTLPCGTFPKLEHFQGVVSQPRDTTPLRAVEKTPTGFKVLRVPRKNVLHAPHCTTPVLLRTTKYYSSTTSYYKGLQYYKVLGKKYYLALVGLFL